MEATYKIREFARIQQIATLKFMGFSLAEIKGLLARPRLGTARALRAQIEALDREIERLRRAGRALRGAARDLEAKGRVDWTKIIRIMEELTMNDEIKKDWVKKFYTEAELKEFEEVGKAYPPEAMKAYQQRWTDLIAEVQANLNADPAGPLAQDLALRWMALFDEAYGGHPNLEGKIRQVYQTAWKTGEVQMPYGPEVMEFIQKAKAAAGGS